MMSVMMVTLLITMDAAAYVKLRQAGHVSMAVQSHPASVTIFYHRVPEFFREVMSFSKAKFYKAFQ